MNGLPYYKAYPRDFIEGTIGMSFELKGAYRLVLDLIYMQGGNLPDDARYISGLLGCSIRKWKSLRDDLIAAGKLQVSGEFLTNKRAEKELETLAKLQEAKRENRSAASKNKDLEKRPSDHTEPEPEEKEEPNGSSKKRGSRLSPDWRLPKAWGEWAVSEGLDDVSIRREADKFRDYWISAPAGRSIKRDWQAVWRNWVRKVLDDRRSSPRRGVQSGSSDFGAFGKIPERC